MEECSDESEVMRRKLNFLVWDLELEMSSLRKQQGSWRVGQGDSGRKSTESRNLAKPSVVREREQRKKKKKRQMRARAGSGQGRPRVGKEKPTRVWFGGKCERNIAVPMD